MKTTIKIFTEARNEKNALVVLNKVKNKIEYISLSDTCEPYHKGGYICRFEVDVPNSNWNEMPYELLNLCQSIGHAWQISGSIEEEFDAWSNDLNVPGVNSVHVQCSHKV